MPSLQVDRTGGRHAGVGERTATVAKPAIGMLAVGDVIDRAKCFVVKRRRIHRAPCAVLCPATITFYQSHHGNARSYPCACPGWQLPMQPLDCTCRIRKLTPATVSFDYTNWRCKLVRQFDILVVALEIQKTLAGHAVAA